MISDDKRREVAAKLRDNLKYMRANEKWYEYDLDSEKCGNRAYRCIAASVEESVNFIDGNYIHIVETLADLIDRPTCSLDLTDVETHGNAKVRTYECSECGRTCEEIYGEYERCPQCGAKVVRGDE